jgi:DNA damage-binding protein 1
MRLVSNGNDDGNNCTTTPWRGGENRPLDARGGGGGGKRPTIAKAATGDSPVASTPPPDMRLAMSRVEGGSGVLIAVPPLVLPSTAACASSRSSDMMEFQMSSSSTALLGGVLILGQRLVTYHSPSSTGRGGDGGITLRAHTGGSCLLLSWCRVNDDNCGRGGRRGLATVENDAAVIRYLIGDEYGRLHLLSLTRERRINDDKTCGGDGTTMRLCLDALGTTTQSSSLSYLGKGRVFVGSAFGNSQLVRILDSPIVVSPSLPNGNASEDGSGGGGVGAAGSPLADTTYVEVLEEYDNLGPIVDFDLRPCGGSSDQHEPFSPEGGMGGGRGRPAGSGRSMRHRQSLVVTCSGVGRDGTIRLVRNGVGMREHAAVEMGGIVGMWSLRRKFTDVDDSFLVQSFVRETRVLGVQSVKDVVGMEEDEEGGEEKSEMELEDDEGGGALAEVTIPGFNSYKPTLFAGNLMVGKFDMLVQVVDDGVRLIDSETLAFVAQWSPLSDSEEGSDDEEDEAMGFITVASANESGQIIVALRGGVLVYLLVQGEDSLTSSSSPTIRPVRKVTLDREISCVDLNPFGPFPTSREYDVMEIDVTQQSRSRESRKSQLVAVGLWDDFSVRLLKLVGDPTSVLEQVIHINLSRGISNEGMSHIHANGSDPVEQLGESGQHMMARSLCLVTMNSHASTTSNSIISKSMKSTATRNNINMLLVGLGDGTLISFVVNQTETPSGCVWSIHSRKEVSLGTQGVHLVPFQHGSSKSPHSCILATGDRPTVVYLTGGNAGGNSNPKLNYSTISLTVDKDNDDDEVKHASHKNITVNVAAPFRSSLLFSSANSHNSSICVSDDSTLRLGMIDNIQKLHVTSFKLGMTPRRIAYHEAGRVYCVGCIAEMEHGGEANQNNCVRFFDDFTFEELDW